MSHNRLASKHAQENDSFSTSRNFLMPTNYEKSQFSSTLSKIEMPLNDLKPQKKGAYIAFSREMVSFRTLGSLNHYITQQLNNGFFPNYINFNKLILILGEFQLIDAIFRLYNFIRHDQKLSAQMTESIYSNMLIAMGKIKQPDDHYFDYVMSIVYFAQETKHYFSSHVYSALDLLFQVGKLTFEQILKLMDSQKNPVDHSTHTIFCNTLLDHLYKKDDPDSTIALRIARQTPRPRMALTLNLTLNILSKDLEKFDVNNAIQLVDEAITNRDEIDESTIIKLINMIAHAPHLDPTIADDYLNIAIERKIASTITYNARFLVTANHPHTEIYLPRTLQMFRDMLKPNNPIKPNADTFSTLLKAIGNCKKLDEALFNTTLTEMETNSMHTSINYSFAMSALYKHPEVSLQFKIALFRRAQSFNFHLYPQLTDLYFHHHLNEDDTEIVQLLQEKNLENKSPLPSINNSTIDFSGCSQGLMYFAFKIEFCSQMTKQNSWQLQFKLISHKQNLLRVFNRIRRKSNFMDVNFSIEDGKKPHTSCKCSVQFISKNVMKTLKISDLNQMNLKFLKSKIDSNEATTDICNMTFEAVLRHDPDVFNQSVVNEMFAIVELMMQSSKIYPNYKTYTTFLKILNKLPNPDPKHIHKIIDQAEMTNGNVPAIYSHSIQIVRTHTDLDPMLAIDFFNRAKQHNQHNLILVVHLASFLYEQPHAKYDAHMIQILQDETVQSKIGFPSIEDNNPNFNHLSPEILYFWIQMKVMAQDRDTPLIIDMDIHQKNTKWIMQFKSITSQLKRKFPASFTMDIPKPRSSDEANCLIFSIQFMPHSILECSEQATKTRRSFYSNNFFQEPAVDPSCIVTTRPSPNDF